MAHSPVPTNKKKDTGKRTDRRPAWDRNSVFSAEECKAGFCVQLHKNCFKELKTISKTPGHLPILPPVTLTLNATGINNCLRRIGLISFL